MRSRSRAVTRATGGAFLSGVLAAVAWTCVWACSADPPVTAPPAEAGADVAVPPTGECGVPFIGDPSKPMEIELRALTAAGTDVALTNGADLALIFPPQGGRVSFVGVRAKNLDPCAIRLTGALRDTRTKQVRVDARTVNLQRTADGFGVTGVGNTDITSAAAITAYANVPLCPNQWAEESLFDNPYEVEVQVVDQGGRKGGAKAMVTPRCAEPERETQCKCLCKKGYVLGESCGEDAGVAEAGQ